MKDKNVIITWIEYMFTQNAVMARWCSTLTSAVMKGSVRVNNNWLSSVLRNRILTNSKRHQGCSKKKSSGTNPPNSTKVINTQREKSNKLSTHWFYAFWRFENKPEDFSQRSGYILSFEKGKIKGKKWEGIPFLLMLNNSHSLRSFYAEWITLESQYVILL